MVAVGYTSKGEIKEFECSNGILFCWNNNLVSLEIPGSVRRLWCSNNLLTKLTLPEGVEKVYCYNNKFPELIIPESVKYLYCDKEVCGLEELIGEIKIVLW